MKLLKLTSAGAVVAMALSVLLASASYASESPRLTKELAALTGQGISGEDAKQAIDVQGKVAQADLVRKLQAAMGSAYAGVWFEPTTAQLRVGATSSAARQIAEEAVARAGLQAHVVITPVRSTSAELLATQRRWNHKLTDLFAHAQVETALEPQRNAVSVTLASSVPAPLRAALEREAATANVNVLLTVSHSMSLAGTLFAKTECKKWVTFEAYCNPSITPGVTIKGAIKCRKVAKQKGPQFFATEKECKEREKTGTEGEWERIIPVCSAGPLAITEAGARVMLTAGHCVSEAKETWWAINKAEKESAIGSIANFTFGKLGDFADVPIEAAWQTGKANNPVFAVTAEWKRMNEKKEETSYPVKGERVPAVKNTTCHSGQTSGESCGEITSINRSATFETEPEVFVTVEGLVEVREPEKPTERLIGEGGDSGGPWMLVEANNEALMEGTLTGGLVPTCVEVAKQKGRQFFATKEACENLNVPELGTNEGTWERKQKLVFFPLRKTEKESPEGSLDQLKLKLLTTANEVIEGGGGGCEESKGEKCLYVVNGTKLASGQTAEITASQTKAFTLKGKAAGAEVQLESGAVSLEGGAKLIGGNPGTDEETVVFEKITTKKPASCAVVGGKVKTGLLKSELVELVKGGKVTKEDAVLFKPKTGSVFAELEFENSGTKTCPIGGKKFAAEGTVLAKTTHGLSKEATLTFTTEKLEYRTKGSSTSTVAELKFAGEAATLAGEEAIKLVSGAEFGTD
jgi:hypothetical protein